MSNMLDEQQALAFVREMLDSELSGPFDSGYFKLVNTIGSVGFTGSGFSGFGADLPSTGFITEIDYYSSLREFTITGALISVPSLKGAVLAGDAAAVSALLFGGNDALSGLSDAPLLLHGFGGHDTVAGSASSDQLFGDDGNDVLKGGLGDDVLDGGDGSDTASFALPSWVNHTAGVTVDLRIQSAQDTGQGNDLLRGIENVWGTPYPDTLRGDEGRNVLDGGAGGPDQLYGYGGDDDLYTTGRGVADGGAGYDTLSFVRWNVGHGMQIDLGVVGAPQNVGDPLFDNYSLTVSGIERVNGSSYGDLLKAGPEGAYLYGGGGGDKLVGAGGSDTLQGASGDDTIEGGGGTNYLRGDDGNDSIVGGSGFDDINGNMGDDTCVSGGGDDWVVGGKDNDSLTGSDGTNLVYGNLGDDTCDGGAGDDIVRGGQQNDIVLGGAGDDYVSGDKGDDTVTGGAGADRFHTFGDAGIDRVTDFHISEGDKVQLDPGTTYSVAQSGSDTVITMSGGQMILVGVQMNSLPDGWIFGA